MSDFNDRLNDLVRFIGPQLKGGFEEVLIDYRRDVDRLRSSLVNEDGAEVLLDVPDGMLDALRALVAVQFPNRPVDALETCTVEIENGGDVHIDANFAGGPAQASSSPA